MASTPFGLSLFPPFEVISVGIIGTPQLLDAESDMDESFVRSYQRTYQVFASTDVDENYVRSNLGIAIGFPHPTDPGSLCKGISVRLSPANKVKYDSINNPAEAADPPPNGSLCYKWEATVTWGVWDPGTHTATGNPVDQPTRVFFESQTFEEICDKDVDGVPIMNSAYTRFDPPVTRDKTRPVLRVVRNEATFSDSTILAYADKVNSDVVGAYPVRTLKCSAPTAEKKFSQDTGNQYYEVTYLLSYNEATWDKEVLDAGYEELDPSDPTKRRKVLDGSGQPISTPALLDGEGHPLPPPIDEDNAVYLTFRVYEEIDFASSFDFATGIFN